MHEPSPTEVREAVQAFADSMRPGWKVYEHDGKPYAGHRFEYRGGTQALLWAQPTRYVQDPQRYMTADPMDLVKEWSAHVNLKFSAGPEVSTLGKYADVETWASYRDKALSLPLSLQECKTREDGEAMASLFAGDALVLLAAVFDLDMYDSRQLLIRQIVNLSVPAGRTA
jgi:hypothetical protein